MGRRRRQKLKAASTVQTPVAESLLDRVVNTLGSWRTLRWYLLLLLPHMAADVYLGMRSNNALLALFTIVMGAVIAAGIVADLHTGMTSSNWGTYHHTKQPIRYWCCVSVWAVFYIGMIGTAVFAPIAG